MYKEEREERRLQHEQEKRDKLEEDKRLERRK